ncbi:hypothetical protein K1719_015299 [Acacia pycnantha]|nr:hypothetical protein K1719_015299 [Acacia pycnantha]
MKESCEVEAMGIHYKIRTQKSNPYSSKLFRKTPQLNEEEDNVQTQKPEEEAQRCRGVRHVLKDVNFGSVLVNQKPADKPHFSKISGYVTQKDTLFPLLTVEETLMFSAKLRLKLSREQLCSKVKSLIHELGLSHASGTRIGDERDRGISGGERRRVSIGVEVIHDP